MSVPTVTQLWRYPVKSMQGEQRDATRSLHQHRGTRFDAALDQLGGGAPPIPRPSKRRTVSTPRPVAKTMKTKTWTVIANTGKQAALESGLEKKEVPKPTHISARDFIHWLAAESRINDDSLRSLFKL